MPHAKRRATFARPPVGTGVSQAWGVETWTVAPSAESAETRLKKWTSQEIQESTNLVGVTMTMPEGQRNFGLWCRAGLLERLQLLEQLRPSPFLEKHVALQLWTNFTVSNLEVRAILWKRRLL